MNVLFDGIGLPGSRVRANLRVIGDRQLTFQPIVAGRTYTPQFVTALPNNPTWQTVVNTTQNNNGSIRTVTDLSASPPEFYRIQISFP